VNTISGILFFVAFLPYIWAILNHQTVPSPISWAIWMSVDALALIAMKKKRAEVGQLTGAVAGASVITLLALIFGKPTMGPIEWISVAGALLGIVLWQKTGNALTAIVCAQIATFAGAIPTVVHGYTHPSEENPIAWSIWLASCVFAFIAIRKKWNLENALQPLTFTVIETTMVILVVIRPHL
jgi:hypothetical protein